MSTSTDIVAAATAAAKPRDDLYEDKTVELSDSGDSFGMEADMPMRPPAASSRPPAATSAEPDVDALRLHDDETQPTAAAAAGAKASDAACCQCGRPMGESKGATTKDGPLHPQCIAEYKFLHQPRCRYCNIRFRDSEAGTFEKDEATGHLYHPACRAQAEAGKPYVQPRLEGEVRKFAIARSKLSRHNWKTRYFVLSPTNGGIRYYADRTAAAAGQDTKGNDVKSDGSASYDPDADPDREAREEKRAKGFVPLDKRSRLLTRPNLSNYRPSSSSASDNDIGIIFFESKESQKELRLIFQCGSVEQRNAWIAALEAYIYTVDDPADYAAATAPAKEDKKKS